MNANRKKLEKDLSIILEKVNAKRNLKTVVTDKFVERGFLAGEINSILSGTNPLHQLTDELICLLVWILYHNANVDIIDRINPEKVLTKVEIEQVKTLKVDRKKEEYSPIFIENVNEDVPEDWSTVFYLDKSSDFFDNRTFKYNHETQRPLISKVYSGGHEAKEIDLNERSVKAIKDNIVNDRQIPDEITLNILATGDEEYHYDPIKKIFTLYKGDLSVIDGWHRLVACRKAYYENPNSNFYLKVRIVHWDVDRAKAFIYQKSLSNPLDAFAQKTYDVYNPVNQIIDKLNTHPKSNLQGMIGKEKNSDDKIKFDIFYDALNVLFDIKTSSDTVKIANYLREGFNLITEEKEELLDEQQDDVVWAAYIILLKHCYKLPDWQTKVLEMLDNVDVKNIQYKSINKTFIKQLSQAIGGEIDVQ